MFKTVLVIEDDYLVREALQDVLEAENYKVLTASNGQEGLTKLLSFNLEEKPSLILLDMNMPVMGGREFLDAVLADKLLCLIPVVIVSSNVDSANSIGSKEFLRKPVDINLLLKIVGHYLAA
jgi:CheY-like chemotaxis protein